MYSKLLIVLLICLSGLPNGIRSWNQEFLESFVLSFNRILHAQELVWFISQQLKTDHLIKVDNSIRNIDDGLGLTQFIITNNREMRMKGSSARRNHFSFVITTGVNDPIMQITNKVLLGRHPYFAIFVLPDIIKDMQPVNDLCQFFNLYNHIYSLIYFEDDKGISQFFGINKFPVFKIENRTDIFTYIKSIFKDIASATIDVGGYRFRTPLRQDLPHLFKFHDRAGILRYEGTTYRIMKTFIDSINATIVAKAQPPDAHGGEVVNMNETLELVRQQKIEFSAHAYALFRMDEYVDKTYPLLVVKWCLMVPLYNSVSTYLYPLKPFDWTVWFFVAGVFVALALQELLWLHRHRVRFDTRLPLKHAFQSALLDNFCFIINISIPKPLRRPTALRFLLMTAIFFHGFFLSANYTSLLGSILTVNLFHAQINTMEDIIHNQLPVMIINYELDFLFTENYTLPQEFLRLLLPVDGATYAQHQSSFNTSYAYFITDDQWRFLDEQQKYLRQRIFKFSDICFGSYHLAYPIQTDSSLWRNLEYYTFRVHSSGLLKFYERSTFANAVQAKLLSRLTEHNEYVSASLDHLVIAFIYLGVMCSIAGILLLLELVYFHMMQQVSITN